MEGAAAARGRDRPAKSPARLRDYHRNVARNWDDHYSDPANIEFAPAPIVAEAARLLPPGRALDLACGPGRNSLYLAGLGWRVTAVDSSAVAVGILERHAAGLPVEALRANLELGEFRIEPGAYDLVCQVFYLQRDLFAGIREGVKPGGIFAGTIHLVDDAPGIRPRNPAWLLGPGELSREFTGWDTLLYSEEREPGRDGRPARRVARILARRPPRKPAETP